MYIPKRRDDAIGVNVAFSGPGMSTYEVGFYPIQPMNDWATKCTDAESAEAQIERVGRMLAQAYAAGKRDRSAELLALLQPPHNER